MREELKLSEGLRLEAYADALAAGLPTIGWGHTSGVRLGDVITIEQAEELLDEDISIAEAAVNSLIPNLTHHQFCALVSFTFNLGVQSLSSSTLRKRIVAGEDPALVIPSELPRWNKARDPYTGEKIEVAGLTARRAREVSHSLRDAQALQEAAFTGQDEPFSPAPSQKASEGKELGAEINLALFFEYFRAENPWQLEALRLLIADLREHRPEVLGENHPWVKKYRGGPSAPATEVNLDVPYLYQLDSETTHAGRMCFSSSCAMLLETLLPEELEDHLDDVYLERVFRFGDTTDAGAQVKALQSYGLDVEFRQDGTAEMAKDLLRQGIPVPIGILHYGPAHDPRGQGHWIVLSGFSDKDEVWTAMDPAGELNNVNGGFVSNAPTAGRGVQLSYKNLNQRWMVEGSGSGWLIAARNPSKTAGGS